MYKLICSNLSKTHKSLTNFTGYYRKVANKCDKRVSAGKKHISETDLKKKVTEDPTEPVDGLEENESLSEQSTRSFSSFFTTPKPLMQQEKVIASATNSKLFHSSNPNIKRGGASIKKPFKNKEAEQYYQSAVEQCMKIKYKLDKYYQQANWSSKPSRIPFDLKKDLASTTKFQLPKDKPVRNPEDHWNQIRLPELEKIEQMKSLKPNYQFKDPKIKITYPTHTVRYRMGTNGYKLQHKVKQQVVSDNKIKTVLKDPVPQSLQTMKVKHQPTTERDRATLQQLKTKWQHRKLPLVAAGLLQKKKYDENSEEAKQQSKYEKAVIKQHPTVREANVTVKMAFKNTYNKLLQKSGLLYQGPNKTKEDDTKKQEDMVAKDENLEKQLVQAMATKPEAKVENNDKTLPKTNQKASDQEKTTNSEPEVNQHPISITKQVKMDFALKHPKKILSEKPESFDVDAMCIKNKNSSNTTVNFGNYVAESEEKVKNFVESHKQEDKDVPAKHQVEEQVKNVVTKEATSETFGEYLKKLKELRDQTALEGVSVNKSETSHLVHKIESKKLKEVMEKLKKPPARKEIQTSEPKLSIRATTSKIVEKKRYPISDKFLLKKKDTSNENEEATVVRRTQMKEEKVRSQSATNFVLGKNPLRSPPVKTIRSENLVKKIKLKPLTPTKRKPLEKLVKTKPPMKTVQKTDQTPTTNPLKKIMEQYTVPAQPDAKMSMAELKRINRRKRREREDKLREEVKMLQKKFDEERKQKEEQGKEHKYRLDIAEISPSTKNDENNNQAIQAKEKVVVESLKEGECKVKVETKLVKAAVEKQTQVPKEKTDKTASKLEEKLEENHKYRLEVAQIEANTKNMLGKDKSKDQVMQGTEKVVMEDPTDGSKVKTEENLVKETLDKKVSVLEDKGTRIVTEAKKNHISKYLLSPEALTKPTNLPKSEDKSENITKEVKVRLEESTSNAPLENLKKLTDVSKEQILEELEKASKKLLEKEKHQMRYKYALESFRDTIDKVLEKPVPGQGLKKEEGKVMFQKRSDKAPKKMTVSTLMEKEKVDERTIERKENQPNIYSLENYSSNVNFPKMNPKKCAVCALEEHPKKENLEKASEKLVQQNVGHSKAVLDRELPKQTLKQGIEKPQKPKEGSEKARSVSREIQKTTLTKTKSERLQEKVNELIVSQGIKEEKEATRNNLQIKQKSASESPKKLKKFNAVGYKITRSLRENDAVNDDIKIIAPKPSLNEQVSTTSTSDKNNQEENLAKLKEASTRIVKLVKKLDIIKTIQISREKVEQSANPENQPTIRKDKPPHPKDKSKKERPRSKRDMILPPKGHVEPKIGTENAYMKETNTSNIKKNAKKAQSTLKMIDEQISTVLKNTKLTEPEQKIQEVMSKIKPNVQKTSKAKNAVFCVDLSGSHEKIKKSKQQKRDSPKLIIKLRYMGSAKTKTLKPQNTQTAKSKEKKLNVSKANQDTKSTCSKTQHLEVNTDKIHKQSKGKDIPSIVIFKETPEDSEIVKLDRHSSVLCFSKRKKARIEDQALKLTNTTPRDSITTTYSVNKMAWSSKDDIIPYFGRRRRRRIEDDAQRSRSESINAVVSTTLNKSEPLVKTTSTIIKTLDKPVKIQQETMETTTNTIRKSKRVKNVWDTEHRENNNEERLSTTSCLLTKKQSSNKKLEKSPMPIKKLTEAEDEVRDSKMTAKEDTKPSNDILKLLEVMKKADKELEDMLKSYQIYNIPQTEKIANQIKKEGKEKGVKSKSEEERKIGVETTYHKTIDSKTFVITGKEENGGKKKEGKSLVGRRSDKKSPPNESITIEKPVEIEKSVKSLVGERQKESKSKTREAKSSVDKNQNNQTLKAKSKEVEQAKTPSKISTKKTSSISDSKTVTKLDSNPNSSKDQSKNKLTLKLSGGAGKGNKIIVTGIDGAPGDTETGKINDEPVQKKKDKAVEIPGKKKTCIPDVKVHVSMSTDITQDISTKKSKNKLQLLLDNNLSDLKLSKSSKKLHITKKDTGNDSSSRKIFPSKKHSKNAKFAICKSSLIDMFIKTNKTEDTVVKTIFMSPKVSRKGKRPSKNVAKKKTKPPSKKRDTKVKTKKNTDAISLPKEKKHNICINRLEDARTPILIEEVTEHPVVQKKIKNVASKILKTKSVQDKIYDIKKETTDLKIAAKAKHAKSEDRVVQVPQKNILESLNHLKAQTSLLLNTMKSENEKSKNVPKLVKHKIKKKIEKDPTLKLHESKEIYYGANRSRSLGPTLRMLEKRVTKEAGKILVQEKSLQDLKKEDIRKFRQMPFDGASQTVDNVKRKGSKEVFQTNCSLKNDSFPKKIEKKSKMEKVNKKMKRILTKTKDKDETTQILEGKKSEGGFKAKLTEEHHQKPRRKSKEIAEDKKLTDRKLIDFYRKVQETAVIRKVAITSARVIKSMENIALKFEKTGEKLGTRMSLIETKNSETKRMKNDSLQRLAKSCERKVTKEKKNPLHELPLTKKILPPIQNFSGQKPLPLNIKSYKSEAKSHFELGSFFTLEKPQEKFKSATEPTLIKSNLKANKQKEEKNKYKYTSQKIRQNLMQKNIKNDNKTTKTKKRRDTKETKQNTGEIKKYTELESKKQTMTTIEVPGCSKTSKIEVIKEIPSKIIIPTKEIISEMKKMEETSNSKLEDNENRNPNNLQSFVEQMMATEELQEVFSQYLPKKDNVRQNPTGNTSEIIVILPPANKNVLKFQPSKEVGEKPAPNPNHPTFTTAKIAEISTSDRKTEPVDNKCEDLEKSCQVNSQDASTETISLAPKQDEDNITKSIVPSSKIYGKFSFNQMNFDELFAVEKPTTKAKIEEIFDKHTNEDQKIYKFNKKLAMHFLQQRERAPITRQIMASSKALLDPRALEVNEMQKILYKFLATELKKPYQERPTGFSLLKKYNKFEGIAHYSKDNEESLPEGDKKKTKNLTFYIEKSPPNRYEKREVELTRKPTPKSCEKLCLPLKNMSQAVLTPKAEEMTTLNKPQVEKVQVVAPTIPNVSDKYKAFKITHLNIKRPNRSPDESFLPMVFANKTKIMEKKSDPNATKRQILEFRYELLRKIHKEFTALYEKDVNKNVGKFERVTKYYNSVIENQKEKEGEKFLVKPQSKSIEELLGASSKPTFERVSSYYNLVIEKKERKNQESNEVSTATKSGAVNEESREKINDSQVMVQKLSEKTTVLDQSKNKVTETEPLLEKNTEKDEKDPESPEREK